MRFLKRNQRFQDLSKKALQAALLGMDVIWGCYHPLKS
uniref:Uncharacterized protein n=1 Tax=Arundo donax TaxID=35708 RepID=A0A0A9G3C6_ARUDO